MTAPITDWELAELQRVLADQEVSSQVIGIRLRARQGAALIARIRADAEEIRVLRVQLAATDAAIMEESAARRADLAKAHAALRPFAKEAERYDPEEPIEHMNLWGKIRITVGDLRAARAALPEGERE